MSRSSLHLKSAFVPFAVTRAFITNVFFWSWGMSGSPEGIGGGVFFPKAILGRSNFSIGRGFGLAPRFRWC